MGEMKDQHDMVQYVNGYDETGIVDDRFNRHQRREKKREWERRRQEILNRYLVREDSEEEKKDDDGEDGEGDEVDDLVFRDELSKTDQKKKNAGILAHIERRQEMEREK